MNNGGSPHNDPELAKNTTLAALKDQRLLGVFAVQ